MQGEHLTSANPGRIMAYNIRQSETVIDRVNEVTYEYGKKCGRDLNQKYINYIINNVELDKEEAA